MRVFSFAVLLAAVAAVSVGCSPAAEPVASGPAATPSATATPSPTATPRPPTKVGPKDLILTGDGIGPYRIGVRAADLRAAGLLGSVENADDPECPGTAWGKPTGAYKELFTLILRDDVLVEISVAIGANKVRTPEGASMRSDWKDLRRIYGNRIKVTPEGDEPEDVRVYTVRYGDRVIAFSGHPIRPGLGGLQAGLADSVEQSC